MKVQNFLNKLFGIKTEYKKPQNIINLEKSISQDFKLMLTELHENEYILVKDYGIHLIEVNFNNLTEVFEIEIVLSYPGIFIGKAGQNIKKINDLVITPLIGNLREETNYSKIEIKLKEFNPFAYKS